MGNKSYEQSKIKQNNLDLILYDPEVNGRSAA